MSESRSNQTGQTGWAILIIVVLFGALFLGVGGLVWVRMRAQRAAEVEARYQEQVARERAEEAIRAVEARKAKHVPSENADAEGVATEAAPAESESPGDVTISLEDCKASRPAHLSADTSLVGLLLSGAKGEPLIKRGVLELEGERTAFYLPQSPYSLTNSGEGDGGLTNTSTRISIDQNGDGKLTEDETWFANQELRVGDRMFSVIDISADGSRIVLRQSDGLLQGVVVGRRCPQFSFDAPKGEFVTLDAFQGKAVLFDIWSIT